MGLTLGYQWSDADFSIDPTGDWEGSSTEPFLISATEGTLQPDGVLGGLKGGLSYQTGNIVLAVEADMSLVDGEDENPGRNSIPTTAITWANEASLDWLATLRGKAGFAIGRTLIYGTGGVALGDWNVEMKLFAAGTDIARFSSSSTEMGWVAGGGLEYSLGDSWTVNAEYLYLDFGDANGSSEFAITSSYSHNHSVGLTTQVARAGISYRF